MGAHVSSLFSYFFGKGGSDDDDDDLERELYLAEMLLELEIDNACNDQPEQVYSEPTRAECFQRTGIITFMDDNRSYVLINDNLHYELPDSSPGLHVKDRVCYLGYKKDNDSIKVVRILQNNGPAWDEHDELNVDERKYEVIEHVIIGEVDYRKDRFVYMKDSDLKFSLDDVESSLVPMQGDFLELKCTMQWDDSKPTEVSPKQVVTVSSLRALRTKVKKSKVTHWDGDSGVCDSCILFTKNSLENSFVVGVGSSVYVEAIESNQGVCTWRAVKMMLDDSIQPPSNNNTTEEVQDVATLQLEREVGIEMTHPLKFENVDIRNSTSMTLCITNHSHQTHTMKKWMVLTKKSNSQVHIKPFLSQDVKLHPGDTFTFTLYCKPKFLGLSKEIMVILFSGFQLKRFIETNVANNILKNINCDQNRNKLKNEYELMNEMRNIRNSGDGRRVPGVRPVRSPNFISVKLGLFPIPDKIWSAVLGDSEQTIYGADYGKIVNRIEEKLPCLSGALNIYNYSDKWHTLLYMEEIQQNISMRVYDMEKAFLDRHQEYLSLEIKGLSEKRPSLVRGDTVTVKEFWNNDIEYEGYVHELKGNLVLFKFNPQFHEKYSGSDVSIQFRFSRSTFRRSHQAINLAIVNLGPDLLFPSRVTCRPPQLSPDKVRDMKWFNIKLNAGQKAAVRNILLGECRPMPYCIYGPPGTGKTMTVIEAILQILTLFPDSRVLVATPSNSASNLITERLIQYREGFSESIVRLLANYLIESDTIPAAIKPYCATLDIARENTAKSKYDVNRDGVNLNCRTSFIGRHRVTIGTCSCIGTLAQMGLPKGHFTHVIIDEAGQATEPEIMIPMTFTDKDNGQIILAGDPMQLGPVVMSKYCVEFGMDESYLSRMLERFPYQRDYDAYEGGYDQRLVTKLNDNYRSLQEVLEVPNKLFYDGTLVPRIERNQPWISRILKVVSKIFSADESTGGIYVHGIRGQNCRAEDSPSWYNPHEASMLALTVCKLYKNGIDVDEIGVITPYIAQVKHLRLVFDAIGLPQPKIGSVEEFQGQERPIVLISTVRSTECYLADDYKHTLGFVKHPKRLNVALTRAQVAVLLFCDPHLLCKDHLWGNVLSYSVKNNKYSGCDLPKELSELC